MRPSWSRYVAGLAALAFGLYTPPAHAQSSVLWDTVVEHPGQGGGAVRFVRTSADGTVTVGGNFNGNYVARLSASGAILWTTTLPQFGNDGLEGIAVGPEGQVYVLHQFGSFSSPTGGDVAIHRVDADGTVAWSRQYDGPNSGNQFRESDRAVDIAVDGQGNVFTTAQTGFSTNDNYVWSQMHAPDGTLLWTRTFDYNANGHRFPTPRRAAVDCAGNVYVIGLLFGASTSVGVPSFFLSYGPDGTPRQEAILGPPTGPTTAASSLYLNELAVDCGGTAYVAGNQTVSDTQTGSSRAAFVSRFDGGSSVPAWTRLPYPGQSGSGNSLSSGEHNLAIGGPDAVYASTETVPEPGAPTRVATVRLRADGSTAWLDPGVAGSTLVRPIAADASGVVVLSREADPSGFSAFPYRHYSPDGTVQWEVRRVSNAGSERQPANSAGALAVHPGGGAVWAESYAHVVRAGVAPPQPVARVQVVHASAALAALGPIEVYLNQPATSTTPDATVTFRSGSAFVDVPAAHAVSVRARLQNPPPPGLPREVTFTTNPLADGQYVVSLAGVFEQAAGSYAQNPSGVPIALQLVLALIRINEGNPRALGGDVTVVVTHAVTDAPAVDVVVAETGQVLADDLLYGRAAPPVLMGPGAHRVEVRNAATGELIEAVRFVLDGSEGVFALTTTGFLNPAANQDGPAFALTATDSTGVVQPGVVVTGADDGAAARLTLTVANPSRGPAAVRYGIPTAGLVRLSVIDVLGREIAVLAECDRAAGIHTARLSETLAPGTYVVRLASAAGAVSRRVTVVR